MTRTRPAPAPRPRRADRRGPGRPPRSEALRTRERLLASALALFAEKGFAATSVREIAGAIGVTDAAIYAHFAGKREIFDALLAQAGPALLGQGAFDPVAAARRPPAAVLPRLFADLVRAWDAPRVRLFTSVLLRDDARSVDAVLREVEGRLEPVVRAWVAAGRLRRDLSPAAMTWELVAPLATIRLSLLHASASPAERARARSLARRHVAYFLASTAHPVHPRSKA